MTVEGRYRPTQLRKRLAQARAEQAHQQRTNMGMMAATVVVGLSIFMGAIATSNDPGLGIFCSIFTFVIGFVILIMLSNKLKRAVAKVEFAQGFLDQIFEDLHPARKLHFYLDTTSYDTNSKQYWSGTSAHGNAKYRYNDCWFRQKFALIDGTTVTIERRADVKVRKGSIQKEKRRLYLRVQPNEKSLGTVTDLTGLEDLVRQRVKEGFHDPPEQIHVSQRPVDDGLRVRITQWDAPIREAEAFLMIETLLLFLHMRSAT